MFFRVLFCFEDPIKIEVELCVVGTNLAESEWFIVANHLSVVTRNVQVNGILNCVCILSKLLVTFSHLLNKMSSSNKIRT